MFERFTDRARRAVVVAQEEARLLNHNYIGTEHLLLGLVGLEDGSAREALLSLGVDRDGVRERVLHIVGRGPEAPSGHVPFTPRAKKALELSLREAIVLGHNSIGTEHLLLGLIAGGEGMAIEVLGGLGHDPASVRDAVASLAPAPTGERPPVPAPAPSAPVSRIGAWASPHLTQFVPAVVLAVLAGGGWAAGSEGALRTASLWAATVAGAVLPAAVLLGSLRRSVPAIFRLVAVLALGVAAVTSVLGAL